jgi:hypothetical protein
MSSNHEYDKIELALECIKPYTLLPTKNFFYTKSI